MKIMLADDEKLVRLGLINMIEELYPGQHTFMEAADGEQALQLITQCCPDILFLDIHMPKQNGLEVFKGIAGQKIAVIMLTGYAEFEYARQALSYGAVEYLLKPASLEELKDALEKALSLKRASYQERLRDYQLDFIKALDLYYSIDYVMTPKHLSPPYHLLLLYADSPAQTRELLTCCQQLNSRETFKENQDLVTSHILPTGEFCILSSRELTRQQMAELLPEGITTIPVREDDLTALFLMIRQIQHLAPIRICRQYGTCLTYSDLRAGQELLPLAEALEKIAVSYQADDALAYQQLIEKLRNHECCRQAFQHADFASIRAYFLATTGKVLPESSFDRLTEQLAAINNTGRQVDIILFIQSYIEKNYMNQIGINTLAELLNLSPNYLSRIFKLKTGNNFIDYLTSVRIEKAKELFRSKPNMTIKAVSEQVGYYSNRYFTKLFLKYTSCLPSDYQKIVRNQVYGEFTDN